MLPAAGTAAVSVLLTTCMFAQSGRAQIERSFNETCLNDDQCTDFRLKCGPEMRCTCVKYYHWDEFSKQCLTYKDLHYMLSDMEEKYHTPGRMNAESNTVFTGMMWTGLAVMVIGLVLGTGCIFYGCCYEWLCCCPSDKLSNSRLTPAATYRAEQTIAPNTSRSIQINSGQAHRPGTQGTGIDYIPALYETTSFDVI